MAETSYMEQAASAKAVSGIEETQSQAGSMEELDELSRSLRGRGSKDVDSSVVLSKVKGMMGSFLSNIQIVQDHVKNGNEDMAAESMKATVKSIGYGETEPSKSYGIMKAPDGKTLTLDDVSGSDLAPFIESQFLNQVEKNIQDLVQTIDDVLPSLDMKPNAKKQKKTKNNNRRSRKHSSDKNDRTVFGFKPSQFSGKGLPFLHKPFPHVDRSVRGHKSHIFSTLLKRSTFSHHTDSILLKHQLREEALGDEVCSPTCEPHEWECNCQNLFTCVGDMTEYDLAVLIAGG